jgi:hypothetical protein
VTARTIDYCNEDARGATDMKNDATSNQPVHPVPDVEFESRTTPPSWAIGERYLIDTMNRLGPDFVKRYTREDGTLIWRDEWPGMDGSDDGYESFLSFPLFYLLGGSEEIHRLARHEWNAVTWQFTGYGQVHREYDAYYDWMHHGESSTYIYYLGLANPYHDMDRQRALRFASMYNGADPEAPNWDSEHRMIRSPINGSKGPCLHMKGADWSTHRWVLANYLCPYEDVPGLDPENPLDSADWKDDRVFEEILDRMNRRMVPGDVPLNLNATSLMTNAFLYTGEERYRQWVLEYLDAWKDRTKKNGGICPDNIGPNGEIGELMDGKWWGGYYGWRWPHGASIILESTLIAGSNAYLLTGDSSWLDLHRSQSELLRKLRKTDSDGKTVLPFRHGDTGWFDYREALPRHPIHLYYLTRSDEDLAAIYERFPEEVRQSWYDTPPTFGKSGHFWPERWFGYMTGENPEFPNQVIDDTTRLMQDRLEKIENDEWDVEKWDVHHWQNLNPVVPEGLIQLTCGSPAAIYHGGLLHGSVRYFDPDSRRPGLPDGVAAVATPNADGSLDVELHNTDQLNVRTVIVRGGVFGEHSLETVSRDGEEIDAGKIADVGASYLTVRLKPGSGGKLLLTCKRYANTPTYDFPWERG